MRALLRLVLIFYLYVRVRLHWAQRGRRDSAEDRLHRANQSLGAVEMSMTAEAAKEGTNTGTTARQAKQRQWTAQGRKAGTGNLSRHDR